MGSISGDEMIRWGEKAGHGGKEERIFVSVRVRPPIAKEIARNDPSDWECVSNTTIVFKNNPQERTMYPTSYTFNRVFGRECNTRQVYDEGAKEVALSVVNGLNVSVFAYGQTSSGKTYTMTGITDCAINDIYDHIKKDREREYVLKFSAMEIYNEAVRDILSNDSSPLRLLDDSERGTVVEKLTEETVKDQMHLKELVSFCQAQRQAGETALNEMSSRSHQILRLTMESRSTANKFAGKGSSSVLLSAVNLVDLAGSERASQASSGGRLKEGCHINRSLLTLGTVIRKLSKGRTGHIPYRDSKLTRILQPFLGGNARTAIVCTISPARSHIEQTRNTLSFATCAKQVVTNAQVNLVMSDKVLVKHLQRELARLENEMRDRGSAASTDYSDALKDKDAQIKKMEEEIKELMNQRNLAESRLVDMLQFVGDDHTQRHCDESSRSEISHICSESDDSLSVSDVSSTYQIPVFDFRSTGESNEFNKIYPEFTDKLQSSKFSISSPARSEISEDHRKELRCIEIRALRMSRSSDEFNLLLDDENDGLLPLTDEDKLMDLVQYGSTPLIPAVEQSVEIATSATGNFAKPCDDIPPPFEMPWAQEIRSIPLIPAAEQSVEIATSATDNFAKPCDDIPPSFEMPWAQEIGSIPSVPSAEQSVETATSATDNFAKPCDDIPPPFEMPWAQEMRNAKGLVASKSLEEYLMMNSSVLSWLEEVQEDDNTQTNNLKEFEKRLENETPSVGESQDFEKPTSSEVNKIKEIKTVPQDANTEVHSTLNLAEENEDQKPLEFPCDQDARETQLEEQGVEKKDAQEALSEDQGFGKKDAQETPVEDRGVEKNNAKKPSQVAVRLPSSPPLPLEFKRKQQEIIDLWHACNVSLVHRTCFFLLFKGDQADTFYIEVECRRLSFLRQAFSQGRSRAVVASDGHRFSHSSSLRCIRREREMLLREMRKLQSVERESLFAHWGIALNSKYRKAQLAQRLWTRTDIEHVRDSASLVAKLIGFVEQEKGMKDMKEMYGLSFKPQQPSHRRSFSWKQFVMA